MQKLVALAILASLLMLALAPSRVLAGSSLAPVQQEANLLQNGDFEGGGDTWPFYNGVAEVQVPPGWKAYYADVPPPYVVRPEYCYDMVTPKPKPMDNGCFWARPEFRDIKTGAGTANRIHSGVRAQKYFTYGRMHEAGLFQQVTGITPGAQLRFSVYMQAWMCNDFLAACDGGRKSQNSTTMHLRVGIDPTGGTNPYGPNVIWSREVDSFDYWTLYKVEAVVQGDTATVFTHSRPEWVDFARVNNDVYVDDASLVVVDKSQAAPAPTAASQTLPPAQPAANSQPKQFTVRLQQSQRPDGSLVHVVQKDDTLFGIALAYGVTVDDIMRLNRLKADDYLQLGQELIVKSPAVTLTPNVSQPTSAPTFGSDQATPVAAAARPVGLCVQAFNDKNGNGLFDVNEERVSGAKFTVMAGASEMAAYTTDGVDKPFCFSTLPARSYTVRIEPPRNYVATTDSQVGVALAAGQTANISFGTRPFSKGTSDQTATQPSAPTGLGAGVVGLVIVAGAVAYAVLRRK